jgi:carbamate kinase
MRIPQHSPVVVVSLDSGLIFREHQTGNFDELLVNLASVTRDVAELVDQGCRVVVSHAGPPSGSDHGARDWPFGEAVESMPIDARGASWQGLVGYILAQCLKNHLQRLRLRVHVCALVTQFEVEAVDVNDVCKDRRRPCPSESMPRTPSAAPRASTRIGPASHGQSEGWRLVNLVEKPVVRNLVAGGSVVVCGASGVAVQKDVQGYLKGLQVRIDEHLAAAQLAIDIKADTLLMLTDADEACSVHDSIRDHDLGVVAATELARYAARGHFRAGAMSSRVEAALILARRGKTAIIAPSNDAIRALGGRAGTSVVVKSRQPTICAESLAHKAPRNGAAEAATA